MNLLRHLISPRTFPIAIEAGGYSRGAIPDVYASCVTIFPIEHGNAFKFFAFHICAYRPFSFKHGALIKSYGDHAASLDTPRPVATSQDQTPTVPTR